MSNPTYALEFKVLWNTNIQDNKLAKVKPKSKRSTVDIPYSLCQECVGFLKKLENYLVMTSGEKDRMLNWRNIWPCFMWDLLRSPKIWMWIQRKGGIWYAHQWGHIGWMQLAIFRKMVHLYMLAVPLKALNLFIKTAQKTSRNIEQTLIVLAWSQWSQSWTVPSHPSYQTCCVHGAAQSSVFKQNTFIWARLSSIICKRMC